METKKMKESNAGNKSHSQSNDDVVAIGKHSDWNGVEEPQSDSVVESTSNISNVFSNLAHTSTPIAGARGTFWTNPIHINLGRRLAFNNLRKHLEGAVNLKKRAEEHINNQIKEFSANGFLEVYHQQQHHFDEDQEFLKDSNLNPGFALKESLQKIKALLKKLLPLLLVFILSIFTYKMVMIAVPYASKEILSDFSEYAQTKYSEALTWISNAEITKLNPIVCGLAVSIFSFFMVYMDSNLPGVNPPSPFTPRRQIYYQQRVSAIQLSYYMAIASGFLVAAFMYLELL